MGKIVNNFKQIYPLLNFEKEGDFYFIQLILRKKDRTTTFGNKNNSARIIKQYYIYNEEHLKQKEEEIIKLCDIFGCRAGINLNKRNDKEVAYEMLEQLIKNIRCGNYKSQGLFDSACGQKASGDKIWIIDCDSEEEFKDYINKLTDVDLRPIDKSKIITELPTYNGWHIITNPFDIKQSGIPSEQIQKNNPTALYYPEKKE